MNKTKKKILDAAISLFNKRGLPNVRLQQIADVCNISVGNLAYHYPSRDNLMEFVASYINEDINPILDDQKQFPHLIDFDNQLSQYYSLINNYAFFFLDILELERSYSQIHNQRAIYIDQMIIQIEKWITENVEKNIFNREIHNGQYLRTAQAIWMIITFWMTQQKVRSKAIGIEEEFKQVVWNQLVPVFTDLGMMEYEALILPRLQQYGPDYQLKFS